MPPYLERYHVLGTPYQRTRSAVIVAASFTILLGGIVIWGVGFSPITVLHNAAHDVRHSNGFPCH